MFGANIKQRTVQECLAETASELYKDFVSSIVNSFLLGFSPRLLRANPQFKQTAKTGKIATQSATIPPRGEILYPVFRQRLNADGVAEASAASLVRFPTGVLRRKEGSAPRSCLQLKGARPPLLGAGEGHGLAGDSTGTAPGQAGRCLPDPGHFQMFLHSAGCVRVPAECWSPRAQPAGVAGTETQEVCAALQQAAPTLLSQHVRGLTCILITSAPNKVAEPLSKTKANKTLDGERAHVRGGHTIDPIGQGAKVAVKILAGAHLDWPHLWQHIQTPVPHKLLFCKAPGGDIAVRCTAPGSTRTARVNPSGEEPALQKHLAMAAPQPLSAKSSLAN